jgi:hypothetical protein
MRSYATATAHTFCVRLLLAVMSQGQKQVTEKGQKMLQDCAATCMLYIKHVALWCLS